MEFGMERCCGLNDAYAKFMKHAFREIQPLEHWPNMASGFVGDSLSDAIACVRSMSNPNRVCILVQLANRECTVTELMHALDLEQAYVSQQLARLRREGLVEARRDGRRAFYSLTDARLVPVLQAICDLYALKAPSVGTAPSE